MLLNKNLLLEHYAVAGVNGSCEKNWRMCFQPYIIQRKKKMGFQFPYTGFFSKNRQIISDTFRTANSPLIDVCRADRFYINMVQYWPLVCFALCYELFLNENIAIIVLIRHLAEESINLAHYGSAEPFTACKVVSG